MPHITIEYSANVADHHDVQALVAVVHAAALDHGLPPAEGLRTRATRCAHYRIADGHPDNAFIAIAVRIGPGRDAETKSTFLNQILDAAEAQVVSENEATCPLAIAWSIELIEIDAEFRINRNNVRTRMQERN